jgi:hypothetical protein
VNSARPTPEAAGEADATPESLDGRMRKAYAVGEVCRQYLAESPSSGAHEAWAEQFVGSLDSKEKVGRRHHTVPSFVLKRWSDGGRLEVYSRADGRTSTRMVDDLAQRDFYTFVDTDGEKNSLVESALGLLEAQAAPVMAKLLNPFVTGGGDLSVQELGTLSQFASFQVVRTARYRREYELQAEWYAKKVMEGRVVDAELRKLGILVHQNEPISMMGELAEGMFPYFACRPVALVVFDRPRLYIGDDPVIVNSSDDDGTHHADCFLTEREMQARFEQARPRKVKKGRRRPRVKPVSRVLHVSSTVSRGVGVAEEIVLPVSPRAALVWGPLQDVPSDAPAERAVLHAAESERVAGLINDATCRQALDWVVTRTADESFVGRTFPPLGPLMRVCDSDNAASLVLNTTPERIRPARLWLSEDGPSRRR